MTKKENSIVNKRTGLKVNYVNREYADSVFRTYFNDKERLKSLYCGLTGTDSETVKEIEIVTLDNVIYGTVKNDLAFTVDTIIIMLAEHQTTINDNMPARFLIYFAEILRKIIGGRELYGPIRRKLPKPKFFVLYNGVDKWPTPGKEDLLLSKSFEDVADDELTLELKAKVININYEEQHELLGKCPYVKEYAEFIYVVRQGRNCGLDLNTAVDNAIDYCLSKGIMKEFLMKYGKEVQNMLLERITQEELNEIYVTEMAEIRAEKMAEEMAEEKAKVMAEEKAKVMVEKILEEKMNDIITNLKRMDCTIEQIMAATGLSRTVIETI